MKTNKTFMLFFDDYLSYLKKDYLNDVSQKTDTRLTELLNDFAKDVVTKKDKEYQRIFIRNSIHSFVVIKPTTRLKEGDILRPINKTKPNTDFVHGNILEHKYSKLITWAGI
jgi:hypothetical protein